MEIYIACFAGLLSSLLLAVVVLADRWEREPLELVQDHFLAGLGGQLVLILVVSAAAGPVEWSGPWLLLTAVLAAAALPFVLHRQDEVDERFDGVVYAVCVIAGAACAIHIHNLPLLVATSPYRDALASGTAPDLRDLLIVAGWPGFAAELGRGLVLVTSVGLAGAALGILRMRGWRPVRTAAVCVVVAAALVGADLALAGPGWWRAALVVAAVATGAAVKSRSVFRNRPQPAERDVLVMALRTALVVFGAALLAMVVLQASVPQPERPQGVPGAESAAAVVRPGTGP